MVWDFSGPAILSALGIFALRVTDMSLDTLRLLFVMRGRKLPAWILGFFQATIFVVAISSVLSNLTNPLTVIGYAGGYATGIVIGIIVEDRLAIGFTQLTIISSKRGLMIAETLRERGYAVTEVPARGKDGMVTMLNTAVRRREVSSVEAVVLETDPNAFVTSDEVRPIRRGYWRA
ncbi:MAG TPA: DUF2179 domain-containing protein [Chloroflexi bacterium]|nr:DUF2179 domain-containing protein [Chloroflexota bacterium]